LKCKVYAKVSLIIESDRNGVRRLLLTDVYTDDVFFRDHLWVKSSKRLAKLVVGDRFKADGTKYSYVLNRIGIKHFRSIEVFKE